MHGFIRTSILVALLAEAYAMTIQQNAACTRESLKEIADSYVAAQTAGTLASLKLQAPMVDYAENDKKKDIATGVLSKALKIDNIRHGIDTTECATYTELIVTDSRNPYVIGTQIRLNATTDGNLSIYKMESIVTDRDDWLFNATGTLRYAKQEKWEPIAVEKRDSRAVIKAAADAYLDLFRDKNVKVPWGTPCARLEGGSYTGRGQSSDSCNMGVPAYETLLIDRRYVLDETMGAVAVFLKFGPAGIPDSHEFRVEGGKLRFIHTMTAMDGRKGRPSKPG
jgi:hypothetical protein